MCKFKYIKIKFLAKFILFISIISCQQNISYENRINDDVNYLSNDKLEGRKTGSNGEQIAADYIADRFKNLKIKATGTNTYFQDFNFNKPSSPVLREELSYGKEKIVKLLNEKLKKDLIKKIVLR